MKPALTFSAVIPVLNEEKSLLRLLSVLASSCDQVIVADGGSTDATLWVARQFSVHVVTAARGKASQMNAGAKAAAGDILWFLHADTRVPNDWKDQMLEALAGSPQVVGGAFRISIDAPGLRYRMLDAVGLLRFLFQRSFFGDQGIFVRRELFEKLGGFSEKVPVEDLDFSLRMKRAGGVKLLPGPLGTSARRWQEQGYWRTVFRHSSLVLRYACGV